MARVQTTEQSIQVTTSRLGGDIANLSARKTRAISAFRQTADELAYVNEELQKSLLSLGELQKFIDEQTKTANQMISDNSSVRNKILDIIGEN